MAKLKYYPPLKKSNSRLAKDIYDNNDATESKSRFGKGLYGNNDVAQKVSRVLQVGYITITRHTELR